MVNLTPKHAIVFYDPELESPDIADEAEGIFGDFQYVIYFHELTPKGMVKSTTAPTMEQIKSFFQNSFAAAEAQEAIRSSIFGKPSKRILAWKLSVGRLTLCWWTEKKIVQLERYNGKLKYLFPRMIFIYREGTLHIYAIKTLKDGDTMLYSFPFPHVSADGTICIGTVGPKITELIKTTSDIDELALKIEAAFFNAKVTHPFSNEQLKENRKSIKSNKYTSKLTEYGRLKEIIPDVYRK